MKNLVLVLILFVSKSLVSQWLQAGILSTNDSLKFEFSSFLDVHSTSIQNKYAKKIIIGGLITEDEKENMYKKHRQLNRLGLEYMFNIKAEDLKLKFKKRTVLWNTQIANKILFASSYSKDFFGIMAFGNEKFLGDTLKFKASKFNYYSFQKFGLGISFPKYNSKLYLNLVNLSSFFKANINGDFYSDYNADYFYWNVQAKLSQNPSTNFSNGIGFSVDYSQILKFNLSENNDIYFQLKIEDFGSVFTKKSNILSDTSFNFSGFSVKQLFQASKINKEENELMDTLNIYRDTVKSWEFLPFSVTLQKLINNTNTFKWQSFYGLKAYPTLSYFPKLFVGTEYSLKSFFKLGGVLSYGGFGGFRFGLYSRVQLKKMYFFVGLEDFVSVFSKSMYGKNFNLKWSWLL